MVVDRLVRLATLVLILASLTVRVDPAFAQSTRSVTASATCVSGADDHPTVSVHLTNNAGMRIFVSYAVSFSTPQAISANGLEGLALTESPGQTVIPIEPDADAMITAPWAGRDIRDGEVVVALVITSEGLLMPSCGSGDAEITLASEEPATAGLEGIESASAIASTIGTLESLKAYPALYTLLHPDARALISYDQFACAYAAEFGPPMTGEEKTIYSTTVDNVSFVEWTWAVNGAAYTEVAEVTYTQEIGVFPANGEMQQFTEHLVRADGIWRFFYGTDAASIDGLTGDCGLPAYI